VDYSSVPPANAVLLLWPWPWPDDLDIRTWPETLCIPENDLPRSRLSKVKAIGLYTETERYADATNHNITAAFASSKQDAVVGLKSVKFGEKKRKIMLIVLTEHFFARCYGWGATGEYRLKIGDFTPTGAGWPKISRRRGRPPPTILLLRKLG